MLDLLSRQRQTNNAPKATTAWHFLEYRKSNEMPPTTSICHDVDTDATRPFIVRVLVKPLVRRHDEYFDVTRTLVQVRQMQSARTNEQHDLAGQAIQHILLASGINQATLQHQDAATTRFLQFVSCFDPA